MNAPAAAIVRRENSETSPAGPPAIPFVLSVGITGHRSEALDAAAVAALPARISAVLAKIGSAGLGLFERERGAFSRSPPALRFVSAFLSGGRIIERAWPIRRRAKASMRCSPAPRESSSCPAKNPGTSKPM